MPDLSFEESLEITKIYSISGMLEKGRIIEKLKTRQFIILNQFVYPKRLYLKIEVMNL